MQLYVINLDQPHLDRKMNSFKDKLKKVFFTAILKDYMNSMKKKMQESLELKLKK